MATYSRPKPIDLITTLLLFLAGAVGLYQSLQFPGRAGMWPIFVMTSLLVFVGLHLINLFRGLRQPQQASDDTSYQSEE